MFPTTHPQLDRLRRWHQSDDSLFTRRDYEALEERELLARGALGGHTLTSQGSELLRVNGLLRTILTRGRF